MQKKSKREGSVYYNKSRNRFTAQFYELDSKTKTKEKQKILKQKKKQKNI